MRLASEAEQEIRAAVERRLRENLPAARIVHELVVGQCRADVAAIDKQRVVLVEIKSRKDKLTRLDKQMKVFRRASHFAAVAYDEKWHDAPELKAVDWSVGRWRYPEPSDRYGRWEPRFRKDEAEPHAAALLGLLWRAELEDECRRHRISVSSRTPMRPMTRDMAWLLTGREIAEAVCRQLRARCFVDADAPIREQDLAA